MLAIVSVTGLPSILRADNPLDSKALDFFEKKVRPLLTERCYECHSTQSKKLRGGLLLDTRAGWMKGGDSGQVIVPGNPEDSLLIQALQYDDPILQMPPKGKLPDAEIAILTEWVKRGAPDPRTGSASKPAARTIDIALGRQHWAFQPLHRPEPPAVKNEAWCRTPIDRFILAKLEAKSIVPNDAASRRQLIRRASFDLIGLPPSPEEVEAFVNDPAADAYERLIDRLLASPHYGERWARHWLDLARFAESHGFEHDYDRPTAYHYRDFVIEALNQDLPYNTFVKWQLAGDELEPDNNLALKATGFLAAGVHSTQITANQVEKERYDELDDITNTTGTAFLGLTIGCARCHDHKYDPIPQNDYYRLLSTFTTTVRSEVDLQLDKAEYAKAKAIYDQEHAPYVEALTRWENEQLPARLANWQQQPHDPPRWAVLDLVETKSKGGATFTKQDDGSVLLGGTNPEHETLTFVAHTELKGITAIRLEALADPSLTKGGPGRAANGNFDLTDFQVAAKPKKGDAKPVPVKLKKAKATFEQAGLPASAAIDGDKKLGWAVDPQFGKDQAIVFEVEGDLGSEGGTVLTFTLDFQTNTGHGIGRPRLAVSTLTGPPTLDGFTVPQAIVPLLETASDARTEAQRAELLKWYRTIDSEWQALKRAEREHAQKAPKPKLVKALISSEGLPAVRLHTQGADFLEKTHFLKRGDPNQKLGEASQSFLQVLMAAPEHEKHWQVAPPKGWRTSYRRVSLANWITDPNEGAGHLLARVIVNRLWQHHLGRGIVATPSDFGLQGERPTHPELLDWLASELIREGWHLKPIHKLIMTSAVYLEGPQSDPAKAAIEPDNHLFWKRNRQRLEAEVIRDAMLAVGGRLDPTMYGPGSLDEDQKRRSIYFTVKRSKLIPMMVLFDAPDGLVPIGVRSTTTVAPQSLLLMNSPIVRDWARGFADRVKPRGNGSLVRSICDAYAIALSRSPNLAELDDAMVFLERQTASYEAAGQAEPETTALADLCQAILTLNEFIYVE